MSNDRSRAELESDCVAVARMAARVDSQSTAFTTLLHIGDEHLVVLTGHGDRLESVHQIDLGAARIAGDHFRHDPPTAQEIERAIDFAEDQIHRLGPQARVDTTLWSTSAALQAWAAVSGPGRQRWSSATAHRPRGS